MNVLAAAEEKNITKISMFFDYKNYRGHFNRLKNNTHM